MNIEELKLQLADAKAMEERAYNYFMSTECMSRGWDAATSDQARAEWHKTRDEVRAAEAALAAAEDAEGAADETQLDAMVEGYQPVDTGKAFEVAMDAVFGRPVPTNPATPGFGGGDNE